MKTMKTTEKNNNIKTIDREFVLDPDEYDHSDELVQHINSMRDHIISWDELIHQSRIGIIKMHEEARSKERSDCEIKDSSNKKKPEKLLSLEEVEEMFKEAARNFKFDI